MQKKVCHLLVVQSSVVCYKQRSCRKRWKRAPNV